MATLLCASIIIFDQANFSQSRYIYLHDNKVVLAAYCVCKDVSKKGGGPEGVGRERGGGVVLRLMMVEWLQIVVIGRWMQVMGIHLKRHLRFHRLSDK